MVASVLTPLQLDAGAGLLQNQGLAVNTAFTSAITAYQTTDLISPFLTTIEVGSTGNILSTNVISSLETLASNSCASLSDSVPSGYATLTVSTNPAGLTGLLKTTANTYMGNGDLSKFCQAFSIVQGYAGQTNIFVNSAVNSQNYLGNTFTTTNNAITGGITTINLDTSAFSSDLANLGRLINLKNLNNLGSPLALVQQLYSISSTIPVVSFAFIAGGVPQDVVLNLTKSKVSVADSAQALMYRAMTKITGQDLAQILTVFGVTTLGLDTMADLLNPVKIFPNSFQTLTVPAAQKKQPVAIYINSTGSVNTALTTLLPPYVISSTVSTVNNQIAYDRLCQIIPADQALANKALATSLQQINNITNLSLPTLANTVANLQTTNNLPLVSALSQAVPADVANVYLSIAGGTGQNNTILIVDMLGTAAGTVHTQALTNTVAQFSTMNLVALTSTYNTMANVVNGDYGDPVTGPVVIPTGPYADTYTNANAAFGNALISGAQSDISNVVAAYPAQVIILNQDWTNMANQLVLEKNLQANANLNFSELQANSRSSVYGFIQSLSGYGSDTTAGGTANFLESVAELSTFTGQSIVASLRQGTNQKAVTAAGIQTNSNISAAPNPPPPQANLIPSTYSSQQAANIIVK
jgi:hypothetical protein